MKPAGWLQPAPLFVEIGPAFLKAWRPPAGVELPLERQADGRLTAASKEKTIAALNAFLQPRNWQPRARAWCAVGTRGVSLRRLALPGGSAEELHERLLLQIEAEFPLSPSELAWGSQPLGRPGPANGVRPKQELVIAAMKKEWLADYQGILRACGLEPVFTLAALARWNFCGQPADAFALLDVGAAQSELTIFENAVPIASRIVFWDGQDAARPDAPVDALAQGISRSLTSPRVFVSGASVSKNFAARLETALAKLSGRHCECDRLEPVAGQGRSEAIAGLEKFAAQAGAPGLVIQLDPAGGRGGNFSALDWKKWGRRAGLLVAACLCLPYAEALLLKPHLAKQVAAFKAEAARLTVIDRELEFLRNLKQSQPPYLDVLDIFSKSVPPGTHFDSLSLNSHGEVSLRCAFPGGQQVADFRDKLAASGFFTNVVVEEQSPTPDHQHVNVRLSAHETTAAQLAAAAARLTADEAHKDAAAPPGLPGAAPAAPALPRKDTP